MNKHNIIRITLFMSVLVFNPAVADTLRIATDIQINHNTTIAENIASALYKKGLEEKTAKKRARELVKGDERLFALMLNNLLNGCSDITREEVLEYLSTAALFRQDIALNSYDQLIGIYSKLKRSIPNEEVRKKLGAVAKRNALMLA